MNLLEDLGRHLPITTTIGFVRAPLSDVAEVERRRHRRWARMWGNQVRFRALRGQIQDFLTELLPLVTPVSTEDVYVSAGDWTALFNNQRYGSDPAHLSLLAKDLRAKAVLVTVSRGQFPGQRKHAQAEGWGFSCWDERGKLRSVMVSNEGGRWKLYDVGEPLAWEKPLVGPPRTAFSLQVFATYLERLGVEPWATTFYGTRALLVERSPSTATKYWGVDSQPLAPDFSNLAWDSETRARVLKRLDVAPWWLEDSARATKTSRKRST
jgi:hypothetical protein